MEKVKNTVIVWGKDGYNALGLLRQLHQCADVVFLLVGRNMNCAARSKYCTNMHQTHTMDEGLEWLLKVFSGATSKPIIITTGDIAAEFVDNNKHILESLFYVTGTKEQGLLTKVLDKNFMCKEAANIGFNVPESQQCRWNTDISNVVYPCLLKPDKNHPNHHKDFKTKICLSEVELNETLSTVSKESVFVLQEYIKKDADALIYGCRTFSGVMIVAGILIKTRWDKSGDGSFGYISGDIPKTIQTDLIEQFLRTINYSGLFSVEYAMTKDKAYFLEFNLRNDGTSHYFYQAGVNIPMIWILNTLGIDYSECCLQVQRKQVFMAETDDYVNVRRGIVSKSDWKAQRDSATVFRYKDRFDMAPYYWHIFMNKILSVYNKIRVIVK